MPEIVVETGVTREEGWVYFLDDEGDVSRQKTSDDEDSDEVIEKVAIVGFKIPDDDPHVYYLDESNNISRMTTDEWAERLRAANAEDAEAIAADYREHDFKSGFDPECNTYWIVKGNRKVNDLREMLQPHVVQTWRTARLPRDIDVNDRVIFWESAPHLKVVGIGEIGGWERDKDIFGNAHFWVLYQTKYIEGGPGAEQLRKDPLFDGSSFLKAAVAGTMFAVTNEQAASIARHLAELDPGIRQTWPDVFGPRSVRPSDAEDVRLGSDDTDAGDEDHNEPTPLKRQGKMRALSIRQPWAELIMHGTKKIEYRSRPTKIRERVYVYAGSGRYPQDHEAELSKKYRVDIDALPRGVLVGTIEIVDCTEGDDGGSEWHLARPERAGRMLKPKKHPQPGFFFPF
ncbi:MAG: EVE domain-containing protein [Deltaproteobacteria bacterium]|nr:EVE domain-containing protein [Deltaproteobacteria bacterium]